MPSKHVFDIQHGWMRYADVFSERRVDDRMRSIRFDANHKLDTTLHRLVTIDSAHERVAV